MGAVALHGPQPHVDPAYAIDYALRTPRPICARSRISSRGELTNRHRYPERYVRDRVLWRARSQNGHLDYVNAGHNPPYLSTATGPSRQVLAGPAFRLVFWANVHWTRRTVKIEGGETLVLYTTASRAMNDAGDFFGVETFQCMIRACLHASAEVMCGEILRAVTEFEAGAARRRHHAADSAPRDGRQAD